mmetsp:Transcript_18291/g.57544  ORF Transcript_18291/g.57544 Transcript_18291/m.57544 type:complete len:228 (-) Transcript_18291:83-766(-)
MHHADQRECCAVCAIDLGPSQHNATQLNLILLGLLSHHDIHLLRFHGDPHGQMNKVPQGQRLSQPILEVQPPDLAHHREKAVRPIEVPLGVREEACLHLPDLCRAPLADLLPVLQPRTLEPLVEVLLGDDLVSIAVNGIEGQHCEGQHLGNLVHFLGETPAKVVRVVGLLPRSEHCNDSLSLLLSQATKWARLERCQCLLKLPGHDRLVRLVHDCQAKRCASPRRAV